jgi:IS5 family transposase
VQFVFANHGLDTARRELRRGSEARPVEPRGSTMHWPSSKRRCSSTQISRWLSAITVWRCAIAGAGRKPQPHVSLAWIAKQMPIEHDAEMQHYLAGFRRAGLV